jgi:hypothetical protein
VTGRVAQKRAVVVLEVRVERLTSIARGACAADVPAAVRNAAARVARPLRRNDETDIHAFALADGSGATVSRLTT